jgi:hypothetical protein
MRQSDASFAPAQLCAQKGGREQNFGNIPFRAPFFFTPWGTVLMNIAPPYEGMVSYKYMDCQ